MKNKVVDDFFHSAVHYCSIIENFDSKQVHNNLKPLLVVLLDLYSKALYLPEVEPENDKVRTLIYLYPHQYAHNWEVFNPFDLEEPVGASLSDDISDIYKDVKKGILLYEKYEHIVEEEDVVQLSSYHPLIH